MKKAKKTPKLYQNLSDVLKTHKTSFIVFSVLRLFTFVVLIRQIMIANYESAFFCILTVLLLYIPSWVQAKLPVELPQPLEITILCFIFAAEVLGEVDAFYIVIPVWDSLLHTINGFLCAAIGFSLITFLNGNEKSSLKLSPFYLALMSFCFSMTIGVLWEFFEFGMDWLFHTDMQKDTVIHAIHTVSLDSMRSNSVVSIEDISEVMVNGNELGIAGYLDIGLIDTMKDLFVNFIGAVIFCVIGYFCVGGKKFWRNFIRGFTPRIQDVSHENKEDFSRSE